MGLTIDKSRVSETAWGEVDKAALGRRLAEAYASGDASKALVREAYAFMPEEAFGEDGDGKPLFSFSKGWGPHHELIGDSLVTNRGGVQGAAGALAGARSEPSLSAEEIAKARAHIQRHYRDAEMEAPDSLKERVATDEIASSQKPLLAMTVAGATASLAAPHNDGNCRRRFVERVGTTMGLLERGEGQPRRIRAIGITADIVNGNNRRYPAGVLRDAVEELRAHLHESAGQGRAVALLGEAEHPSDKSGRPSLLETVLNWESVEFDGRNVLLEGRLLETAKGKDILALMEGGVMPPISQRGYGQSKTVKQDGQRVEEVTELHITGYDLVLEASDPEAGVTMLERKDEMTPEEIKVLIQEHPEWFPGLKADEVQTMTEAAVKELEEKLRKLLEIGPEVELGTALAEMVAAKKQLEEQARTQAVDEAIAWATKDLPYGEGLNAMFVESLRAALGSHTGQEGSHVGQPLPEAVAPLAEAKRKEYDAIWAKARLEAMGMNNVQVIGPVLELETGIPEYARGAHEFTEAMIRRQITSRRNLAQPKNINEEIAAQVLARFDECYKLPLLREAKLLQEIETTSDLNIPYSASRAILAAVWPNLIATSIFDASTVDQSPTRVYYEAYADESGKHNAITDEEVTAVTDTWVQLANKIIEPGTVVINAHAGALYVEGTDYYIDYLDGKIYCPAGVTIVTNDNLHADYHYDIVREGENVAIERGEFTLGYATLDCIANRLALEISSEAVVFSRSQLGWDATARTLSGLVNELRRKIDKALMYNALTRSLMTASNSGGTWVSATDPIIDFVSYIGVAKEKIASRYYEPTFILMSNSRADAVANWDGFTAAGKRPDADLNANGYIGRLKGLPVFSSTEFSTGYALVGNREIVAYRVFMPMALKGPFPSYSSNKLVAADQWYAEQYDGWVSPIAGKVSHVVIS